MAVWGGGVVNGEGWVENCAFCLTWRVFARSVPIVRPNGIIEGEKWEGQRGREGRRRRRRAYRSGGELD